MDKPVVKEIEKDLGKNFGPVLRGNKEKGEMPWWGQVDQILIGGGYPAKQDVFQG